MNKIAVFFLVVVFSMSSIAETPYRENQIYRAAVNFAIATQNRAADAANLTMNFWGVVLASLFEAGILHEEALTLLGRERLFKSLGMVGTNDTCDDKLICVSKGNSKYRVWEGNYIFSRLAWVASSLLALRASFRLQLHFGPKMVSALGPMKATTLAVPLVGYLVYKGKKRWAEWKPSDFGYWTRSNDSIPKNDSTPTKILSKSERDSFDSVKESCGGCSIKYPNLRCSTCRMRNGLDAKGLHLDISSCRYGHFENQDGYLRCK